LVDRSVHETKLIQRSVQLDEENMSCSTVYGPPTYLSEIGDKDDKIAGVRCALGDTERNNHRTDEEPSALDQVSYQHLQLEKANYVMIKF
jgi:hypothetical protein